MTDKSKQKLTRLKIIALETSSDACSVALLDKGEVEELFEIAPQQHAKLIIPMIEKLLSAKSMTLRDLDAIAFSYGPGSFTGIRLATSIVLGIAYGANLPVLPVSTLRALAEQARVLHGANNIYVAVDAKMREIYWGGYAADANGTLREAIEDTILPPDKIISFIEKAKAENKNECNLWFGVGNGWALYPETLSKITNIDRVLNIEYPRAQEIAKLAAIDFIEGLALRAEQVFPKYLRDKVTHGQPSNG